MKKHRLNLCPFLISVVVALALAGCDLGRPTPTSIPVPPPPLPPLATATATPAGVARLTPTGTPPPTAAVSPTACLPPEGWFDYQVQSGDTLSTLAVRCNTTAGELQRANCLPTDLIQAGQRLYLPCSLPTPTPCVPPAGWYAYTVQAGETLYGIAARYGLAAGDLQRANCLPSDLIQAGQRLYVPYYIEPSPTSCLPRTDWTRYTVQPGENLYLIALRCATTAEELQRANCLDSDVIQAGQLLYVPCLVPTSTSPVPPGVAFVSPTPVAITPPPPGIKVEGAGFSTWPTYTRDWASVGYVPEMEQLWITVTKSYTRAFSVLDSPTYDGVWVEAQAALLRGSASSGYGLLCRYQDEHNFYAFLISGDGRYAILKGEHYLVEWQTPAEEVDTEWPVILVATCRGPDLALSANDTELVSVRDPDPTPLPGGRVGLIVSTAATSSTVGIDYFVAELLD
jgi:LysM repeat protein